MVGQAFSLRGAFSPAKLFRAGLESRPTPVRESIDIQTGTLLNRRSKQTLPLLVIKLLHTAVWFFFVGCIVAIPIAGARHEFRWAAVLSGIVLCECAIIAVNRWRCPLTDLAGRYTDERTDNFDIYLPLWLARHNKTIFGTLFAFGELFVVVLWLRSSA